MSLNAVMVDLETMGRGPKAAIVSIGAFKFDLYSVQQHHTIQVEQWFQKAVTLKSSMAYGLEVDADTIMWWLKQGEGARSSLTAPGATDLIPALNDFAFWLFNEDKNSRWTIWGNGVSFDNVILRSAYEACNLTPPWTYVQDRCYRTFKNLFGKDVPFERFGQHHSALDDAISQALHLQKMMAARSVAEKTNV